MGGIDIDANNDDAIHETANNDEEGNANAGNAFCHVDVRRDAPRGKGAQM